MKSVIVVIAKRQGYGWLLFSKYSTRNIYLLSNLGGSKKGKKKVENDLIIKELVSTIKQKVTWGHFIA